MRLLHELRHQPAGVRRGADGATLQSGEQVISVESIPVNVVDTVGAGDSFDAGFIYGHLNDWPLEKTLRLAVICGALSTRKAGGTQAQATLPEISNEWMSDE